jgi:hypothetical protein
LLLFAILVSKLNAGLACELNWSANDKNHHKKILAQKQWAQVPLSFAESIGSFAIKAKILTILTA